jgi:hypothetical protein
MFQNIFRFIQVDHFLFFSNALLQDKTLVTILFKNTFLACKIAGQTQPEHVTTRLLQKGVSNFFFFTRAVMTPLTMSTEYELAAEYIYIYIFLLG